MEQTEQGSLQEFISFVLPGARADACPAWPPDVFAVAATVMKRNGAYVQCVATGIGSNSRPDPLFERDWPKQAKTVGQTWREAVNDALKTRAGKGKLSIADALGKTCVPDDVKNAWQTVCEHAQVPLEASAPDRTLTRALIQLSSYADEASYGIGLGRIGGANDQFGSAATLFLQVNRRQSFCQRIDRQKARVLGKKHTPQQGLTLRSLTHHLSLCMPWEVEPQWYDLDAPRLDDVLNFLLLPWPLNVNARDFQCVDDTTVRIGPREHRLFKYEREPIAVAKLEKELGAAIEQAFQRVSQLHAIVLPELALTCEEWRIAERIAMKHGVMLISGIIDDVDDASGLPMNSCRIQMMSLRSTAAAMLKPGSEQVPPAYRQAKHHRWCLDRGQVLQYDLGGQLPTALRCWENSHISRRGIFFAHVGGWLTFSVLICEDLARQDPIADVLRSVGPNLVVALLMDGPQLAARWSARYASVLADDPGSSVLTLTSLGMSERSRDGSGKGGSRVIALWKDKLYGTREIKLAGNSKGCVLSLARERREEFTADGRSDGKNTEVPVFAGVFQL